MVILACVCASTQTKTTLSKISYPETKLTMPSLQLEIDQTTNPPPRQPLPGTILLLLLNIFLMVLGIGGSLLLRFYYTHGGSLLWFSSFLLCAGCPILLIPILLTSFLNNRQPFQLPLSIFICSAVLGLFIGLDNYLYGFGSSYLPASTSAIIFSSQLAFTAAFAFFINRQRFTVYTINAVVLLTTGPVLLGLSSSNDRPMGLSNAKYHLGFVMMVLAAVLMGGILPLMERMYKMVNEGVGFMMVMEIQFILGFFASVFSLVGMVATDNFQAIAREAREFDVGEVKYYIVIVCVAILYQFAILGLMGVISCSSSLFGGILSAAILPIQEVLAVIFFHEKFAGSKGIALTLCLWGFTSYLYGERRQSQKLKKTKMEIPKNTP